MLDILIPLSVISENISVCEKCDSEALNSFEWDKLNKVDAYNSVFRSCVYTVICSAMHNCHIRRIDNF